MTTINSPFNLGETVWTIDGPCREEQVVCPECCGTCVIEMIKGNGERVSLDCNLCAPGFDPPNGWIKKTVWESRPAKFTPTKIVEFYDGKFRYKGTPSERNVPCDQLFRSEEECRLACDAINTEQTKDDERRLLANIQSNRRSLSHSTHYWKERVRRIEEELAAAKARLARCKKPKESAQ